MKLTLPLLDGLTRRAGAVLGRSPRSLLAAGALAIAGAALPFHPAVAADLQSWDSQNWVGTWGAAPAGPPLPAELQTFTDQTLRLIVHTSIGGTQVRIKVSNELGDTPLRIGSAHIALRQGEANIVPGTDRALSFSGFQSITIPAGALVLSDPIELNIPALSDLAISLYLPGTVAATTIHRTAFQTKYISTPGDHAGDLALPVQRTITSWPFLTEVEVSSPKLGAAIVAFGDSITDGSNSAVDANHRWPDLLALRLQAARELLSPFTGAQRRQFPALRGASARLGVVNRGIGGNRLLRDPGEQALFGRAALARFDRDVLATAGVEYVIVLIGINDIGHPGSGTAPLSETVMVDDLIAGYRQLIARAHNQGLAIFGATLTPFEGTIFPGYYSPAKEAVRQGVNHWIRSSDEFDGVIDFDRALRDPSHPARMLPEYDSGDHLHPSDLGMQAMANAIPLDLFRDHGFARVRSLLRR